MPKHAVVPAQGVPAQGVSMPVRFIVEPLIMEREEAFIVAAFIVAEPMSAAAWAWASVPPPLVQQQ